MKVLNSIVVEEECVMNGLLNAVTQLVMNKKNSCPHTQSYLFFNYARIKIR